MTTLAPSYSVARRDFLEAATKANADVSHLVNPMTGLHHEELATDLAWLGERTAEKIVVVMSATHGVEGYAGSALQTQWLTNHTGELPDNVSVLFVHAVNPFGFSWTRRVNEDNVDLNRNFIDFDAPLPKNEGYDSIAELLVPTEWSESVQTSTTTRLLELVEEKGFTWLQQTVSGGQYNHTDGIFHGGTKRTWSNHQVQQICEDYLSEARKIAIIDLHTGLGPWGFGEILTDQPTDSEGYRRLQRWYGHKISSVIDDDSVSAELVGECIAMIPTWLPKAEITAMAIEYGVIDPISVTQALRADAWLWAHGDPAGPEAPAIREATRAAFADDDPAWVARLWEQFAERFDQALAGLRR